MTAERASFDLDYEDDILRACLRSNTYLKAAMGVCRYHHFGTRAHAWLWKRLEDNWTKHRERPTSKMLRQFARGEFKDKSKRQPYLRLLKKLKAHPPKAPKTTLERLSEFVKFAEYQGAAEKLVTALEDGDLDSAEKALRRAAAVNVGARAYSLVSWHEEFPQRQRRRQYEHDHPDEHFFVPTGIDALDKICNGGARPPDLGLVMGTTGKGKSILLSNIAHNAIMAGFNVLLLGFEMRAIQIATRHDSLWSQMQHDRFVSFDFDEREIEFLRRRHKKSRKKLGGKFKIATWPVGSVDMNSIASILRDLEEEQGFVPQVLLLDSADHIKAFDTRQDKRHQAAEVYWAVKALAEEHNFVTWTTTHASASWAKKIVLAEGAAESYQKSQIADLVMSINVPEGKSSAYVTDYDDEDDGAEIEGYTDDAPGTTRMELFVSKYRSGQSNKSIPLQADLSRMLMQQIRSAEI